MCLYILSPVLWCPLRFPQQQTNKKCPVRLYLQLFCRRAPVLFTLFVFFLCIVVSNTYFVVFFFVLCLVYGGVQHILCCGFALFFFALCPTCCQFLWIVHFWLPFWCSLTFICYRNKRVWNKGNVFLIKITFNYTHEFST